MNENQSQFNKVSSSKTFAAQRKRPSEIWSPQLKKRVSTWHKCLASFSLSHPQGKWLRRNLRVLKQCGLRMWRKPLFLFGESKFQPCGLQRPSSVRWRDSPLRKSNGIGLKRVPKGRAPNGERELSKLGGNSVGHLLRLVPKFWRTRVAIRLFSSCALRVSKKGPCNQREF